MAEMSFDASTVAPSTGEYEPIPNGTYPFAIVASETKSSEDGKKRGLQLSLQVLDGPAKGKKMTVYLNIKHPNSVAQDIAQKDLSAICHVTGVLKLTDSTQLHDRPFSAKIKVTPPSTKIVNGETKNYGAGNAVSQFLKLDGTALTVQTGGAPAPAAPPKRAPAPWVTPTKAAS